MRESTLYLYTLVSFVARKGATAYEVSAGRTAVMPGRFLSCGRL